MRAWREGSNFRERVSQDPEIAGRVPAEVIERAFDLKRQLRNIDAIFARVFGKAITRRKSPTSAKASLSKAKKQKAHRRNS
jgi:hypothetical protein